MVDGTKKTGNTENNIEKDVVFIGEVLKELPKDKAFYKQIEHYLYFYAKKAHLYKSWFCVLSVLTVVLPIVVTAISAMSNISPVGCKLVIAILSAMSSISAGLIGVFNLREQWINYRASCEKIKLEVSKFLSNVTPYNSRDKQENEQRFFSNCEMIFKSEGSTWIGNIRDSN